MKIAKGFYINLDYRTDRRALIEEQLQKVGWTDLVERYPAIDGNSPYGRSIKTPIDTPEFRSVTQAALMSHKNIIQYAKDNSLDNILILEDDCLFYDRVYDEEFIKERNFKNWKPGFSVNSMDIINKALEQIDQFPDWQVLCLGCTIITNPPGGPIRLASPNLIKLETALSCHAYIVNNNAYDLLLRRSQEELDIPGNKVFLMDIVWHSCKEKYSVYPHAVVQQLTGITDIGGLLGVGPLFWDHDYDREVIKLYEE